MLTRKALTALTALLLIFCVSASFAQYTITMEETDVPMNVAQKVASQNGVNLSDAKAMAKIAPGDYLKASSKAVTSKIYLASNGNYAVEANQGGENTTIVYDGNKMNIIMWKQKKVMQVTPEEIEQMVKGAQSMMGQMQNMPDVSKMLENSNLPKEQLEAAKKALEGMNQPNTGNQAKPEVSKTGQKASFAGQSATLYVVEEGEKTRGIWVSDDNKVLANKFREMGENMAALSEMAKQFQGTPEWELFPGMYPVASVHIGGGMFGQKNMRANSTKEIVKGEPDKKAFHVPGKDEGFEVGGIEVMMGGMSNKNQ